MMNEDWRLVNQSKYLKGKLLIRTTFQKSKNCDHAHCAFCWDKFGEEAGMLHVGYRTKDGPWWICERCFSDFRELFMWRVIKEQGDSSSGPKKLTDKA